MHKESGGEKSLPLILSIASIFDLDERISYWKNHGSNDNLEENLRKPIFDFLVSDDKHADDLIKTTRDMIDMPLDDDEIIDIVNGLE